jgi:hypothetical protein
MKEIVKNLRDSRAYYGMLRVHPVYRRDTLHYVTHGLRHPALSV